MDVLSAYTSTELIVKNSRFLAEVFPITSQAEARTLLKEQKTKYADSTHVAHAVIVGTGAEIMGMSDDGEPPGTAGRPILDVLKGKNCTNIILTVTRWFGGTLLGTGGLVKAYGDSAKTVLSQSKFHTLALMRCFSFTINYENYEVTKRFLQSLEVENISEQFEGQITLEGYILADKAFTLEKYIAELTRGQSSVSFGENQYR